MASANTVCRIFIDLRRAMQNWMQQLLVSAAALLVVSQSDLWRTAAHRSLALRLSQMDPVSCVLCDAKLDDATAAEAPK